MFAMKIYKIKHVKKTFLAKYLVVLILKKCIKSKYFCVNIQEVLQTDLMDIKIH